MVTTASMHGQLEIYGLIADIQAIPLEVYYTKNQVVKNNSTLSNFIEDGCAKKVKKCHASYLFCSDFPLLCLLSEDSMERFFATQ